MAFNFDHDNPYFREGDLTMKILAPIGRILFSLIFILSSLNHFKASTAQYAASHGVPVPQVLVPLSGVLALLGGLSVLLGYKPRIGAWLLILFLIPVTLLMHNFWAVADPQMRQMQMINFMKNLSMLGGAFYIAYAGGGPFSVKE